MKRKSFKLDQAIKKKPSQKLTSLPVRRTCLPVRRTTLVGGRVVFGEGRQSTLAGGRTPNPLVVLNISNLHTHLLHSSKNPRTIWF